MSKNVRLPLFFDAGFRSEFRGGSLIKEMLCTEIRKGEE
jgi:hypothetical protein